jgi:dTDP-glucose 4,6-dehydratase
MQDCILVTGGAGFIGSALVRLIVNETNRYVANLDKLTYAGSLENVADVSDNGRYSFEQADICDAGAIAAIFDYHQPAAVVHLAAESHVDRSIDGPRPFVESNIVGTYVMLEASRRYLSGLSAAERGRFRFVHVSTDEVFGALGKAGRFDEKTPYDPSSPYSASKASADHLARAWFRTFGVPVIVTNCSNNFGPYQYPEKLIPVTILNLLADKAVPIYGRGENVRDWLYVDDHVRALMAVLDRGEPGATYVVGASNEKSNLDLVRQICAIMDEMSPRDDGAPHADRIRFVDDRPGHDFRYAIDATRIREELSWAPARNHDEALRATVRWYIENQDWCLRRLGNEAVAGGGTRRRGLGS